MLDLLNSIQRKARTPVPKPRINPIIITTEETRKLYDRVMNGELVINLAQELGWSNNKLRNHITKVAKELGTEIELTLAINANRRKNQTVVNRTHRKCIQKINNHGEVVEEFGSVTEAAQSVGTTCSSISKVLHGHKKTCKGFKWKYKEESHV